MGPLGKAPSFLLDGAMFVGDAVFGESLSTAPQVRNGQGNQWKDGDLKTKT